MSSSGPMSAAAGSEGGGSVDGGEQAGSSLLAALAQRRERWEKRRRLHPGDSTGSSGSDPAAAAAAATVRPGLTRATAHRAPDVARFSDAPSTAANSASASADSDSGGIVSAAAAALPDMIMQPAAPAAIVEAAGVDTGAAAAAAAAAAGGEDDDNDGEEFYLDSTVFLKGTNTFNPHQDYCQHFVDTGQRPQNFLMEPEYSKRYAEYPRLDRVLKLKDDILAVRATPPMHLRADMSEQSLASLFDIHFDVVLIDPPLKEYERRAPGTKLPVSPWSWNQIKELPVTRLAASPSFVFLWVGDGDGLDAGRECLRRWGYKRCEDICWVKTNRARPGDTPILGDQALLQHTKEHCLMGIRGSVKRATDGHFVHTNVDIDIIVAEEPAYGSAEKPEEIYRIIEHFCQGRRRLHLFASDATVRPGWLSVGPDISSTNFDLAAYTAFFAGPAPELIADMPSGLAGHPNTLVGAWPEIESMRPKSPPGGRGRGPRGSRGKQKSADKK